MKVVIFAGGLGSRLSEETVSIPKPLVKIGDEKPILWHIMRNYYKYGHREFIILLGYKGNMIKDYFLNYFNYENDIYVNNKEGLQLTSRGEDWKITLIDTGLNSYTGTRLLQARKYIGEETFMATYGDGVGNINIDSLIECHKKSKKLVTLTAYKPQGRFGVLQTGINGEVLSFMEKQDNTSFVNAGFFVCEPRVFNFIPHLEDTFFEQETMQRLIKEGSLNAYTHKGFWKPMDTMKDKKELDDLWLKGDIKWTI
jgi:glucose-1-phosphate cytidylyltransferase